MDIPHSSIEVVDLTESDDQRVRHSRPVPKPVATSLLSNSLHSRKKSASHEHVEPTVRDLADDSEDGANTSKNVKASGNAEEISKFNAHSFLNQSSSKALAGDTPNKHEKVRRYLEARAKETQPEPSRTSNPDSTSTGNSTSDERNWYGFAEVAAEFVPSKQNKDASSSLPVQPKTATPTPPLERRELSSITPRKRKQSSAGQSSEQPVFRTPPKVAWQENGNLRIVDSPALQASPKSIPKLYPAQSPKTARQPSITACRPPITACHSSLNAILPDDKTNKPPKPVSKSPTGAVIPNEDRTFSKTGARSPPVNASVSSSNAVMNWIAQEAPASAQNNKGQQTSLQDDLAAEATESESPTTPSFAPDFDRGRFPYHRRRRGARNAPKPWISKGHHKKYMPEAISSARTPQAYFNKENRALIWKSPLSPSTGTPGAELDNVRIAEGLGIRLAGGNPKTNRRLEPKSIPTERVFQQDPSQPLKQQFCESCIKRHLKCDQKRPTCLLCQALKLVCCYDNVEQTQNRPEIPTADDSLKRRLSDETISEHGSILPDVGPSPNSSGMLGSASASHDQQTHDRRSIPHISTKSSVRIKKEESDQETTNEVPDYLGSTRTRGWHHDGYADVKSLFKKVASDAVLKERGNFIDWPIDLEKITKRVGEKGEEWASKRFGYFVNRLQMSSTSVPNANDVEWLQRKVSQTFFKEVNRAANNPTAQIYTHDSAQAEGPAVADNSDVSSKIYGEAETGEFGVEVDHGRCLEPSHSKSADLPLIPRTTSVPSSAAAPFELHQSSNNVKLGCRPVRAAAGTAASRITSQYATTVGRPVPEYSAPGVTFARQLCSDCNCLISIHNFHTHLNSQKHKNNARQAEAEREDTKQDKAVKERARHPLYPYIVPSPELESEQRRPPPKDRDSTIYTVTLRPQRKALKNIRQKSLAASFATMDPETFRPYQGKKKRGTIDSIARASLLDQGVLLQHVDFTANEISMIKGITLRDGHGVLKITESLANAYADSDSVLLQRDKLALKGQIQRLEDNSQNTPPTFTTIESRVKDPNIKPACRLSSLLRHRELGSNTTGRYVETRSELKFRLAEAIRPWRSFTGASHDVVAVAWAPNSMKFAAGAVAHSNPEDLQYNRPCNLLFGDLRRNTLTELPDHRIDRQRSEAGPNSSQDMFNACDPKVYKTVTTVKFHPKGHQMYTASEDQTVKIWELSDSAPKSTRTLKHDASVTSLDISPLRPDVFATASQKIKNAIWVFGSSESGETLTRFSSARAEMKPEWKLYPESLHWGPSACSSHLLLGGFQDYGREVDNSTEGHLCLWDVNAEQDIKPTPASQAIHAAAWHPMLPYFASGGAPGSERTNRQTTKTVVRAWDIHYPKRLAIEYECPAREMTDITFCPLDHNIVTAGCTNSISYVWDWRWPEQPLHQLRHGKSIMPTGERDTGVMMSLWGIGSSLYYTGSSDGSIRAWDIRRHPNDVLVTIVAQLDAGIQSAAFSPDGSHLLVGDATGGIHVLSSAPWDPLSTENGTRASSAPMNVIRAPYIGKGIQGGEDNPGTEGIDAGLDLLQTGQLILDPVYGPGKGPNYSGPYAKQDREHIQDGDIGRLKKEVYKQQPFARSGDVRSERADPIRILAAARKELLDKRHKDDIGDVEMKKPHGFGVNGPTHLISGMDTEQPSGGLRADNKVKQGSSVRQQAAAAPSEQSQSRSGYSNLSPSIQTLRQNKHATTTIIPEKNGERSSASPCKSSALKNVTHTSDREPAPMGQSKHFAIRSPVSFMGFGVIDNIIPESEMMEENDWWPRLGEEEIAKARTRPGIRKG